VIDTAFFHKKWSFLKQKDVFIACSGGVDSMVLVHLIREITPHITLLHVNYNLRGIESSQDEEFVKNYASNNKLKAEVLPVVLESKSNIQETARKIRYTWFAENVQTENSVLLLAHHQDDQLETFYLNLARKSGNAGMSCMPEIHGKLIRPLLNYSKKEIYDFAGKHNLIWREDSSNKKNDYTRNRLRNEIIPFLETEIPSLRNSVSTLIGIFQENRKQVEESMDQVIADIKGNYNLGLKIWRSLTVEQRIYILKSFGYTPKQLSEVQKLETAQKGKSVSSSEYKIIREENSFYFQVLNLQITEAQLVIEVVKDLPNKFSKDEIYLDSNKIAGELRLRKWKTGDRIFSLGMEGSQLISDIITDAKIPSAKRKDILVVEDDQEIHWCVGLKVGRQALADVGTHPILRIKITS
jgi:tRNA(Ile)-lysidine synthase